VKLLDDENLSFLDFRVCFCLMRIVDTNIMIRLLEREMK